MRHSLQKEREKSRPVKTLLIAAACLLALLTPSRAHAQGGIRQFARNASIGRLSVSILLVGWERDARDVERLLDIVLSRARETHARLDPSNPASELSQLILRGGTGEMKVSSDVSFAFEEALAVAKWTGGRFDVVLGGEGNWRDIRVDAEASTVELKRAGMQIRFDPILSGFLAEIMTRLIVAAGMQNAIVRVGNVFRATGQGLHGPWKIQVQDDEGTFAHHALNLSVLNSGIAAVSASQFRASPPIDPRSKSPVTPPCRGVVALTGDAAHAEGLAYAAFLAGPGEGKKLLSKYGKGLIVDDRGTFIRTEGF